MRRTSFLLAVGLLAALLPACNRDSGKIKVAFISNNPYDFWLIAKKGGEDAAAKHNVELLFRMPQEGGGAPAQRAIIEDMMVKGVRGIAVSPNDAANNVGFYRELSERVPLITQDSDVPDTSVRRCYIGTDNYKAGRAAGDLVKKALPDGGKIMIFVGQLDVQNAIERRQGLLDVLAGHDQAKGEVEGKFLRYGNYILLGTRTDDGKKNKCQAKAEDTLTKFKDVGCLIGLWEYNPPAILRAYKEALDAKEIGKVAIVGFDENPETLQGIKDGHIIGTVVQDPYQFGYLAVEIMAGLARDDASVLKRPDITPDGKIYVPHRVITKDNVEAFQADLNKKLGK